MAVVNVNVVCIVSLISLMWMAEARIHGVYTGGAWQSAHATFYGKVCTYQCDYVSMWRLWNTRTSASLSGMSGVRTRSVPCGGTTFRTHRVLYLWWTAMIETELLRRGMNCIGC